MTRSADSEHRLRELFARLREADRRQASPFQLCWDEADRRAARHESANLGRLGALATLAASVTIALLLLLSRPADALRPELAAWRAPTDALLQLPAITGFDDVPELIPEIPDYDLELPGGE